MPSFGSSAEDTTMGYGIPGGGRGGSYFYPGTNPFQERRPQDAPVRRRERTPAFTSISSVRGGGGGGGFGARPGFQGSLTAANKLAQTMGQAKKNADDFANSLGKATLEMVRLVTWSRPITMGTWMMQEAQSKYGIPLVKGAGLAGLGLVGGLAGTYLLDRLMNRGQSSLWALGDRAGRAGGMDFFGQLLSQTFTGTGTFGVGRREMGVYMQDYFSTREQMQQRRETNQQVGQTARDFLRADFAAKYSAAAYGSQVRFAMGIIPFSEHWSTLRTQYKALGSKRADLMAQEEELVGRLGGGGRSNVEPQRLTESQRMASLVTTGVGFGAGYTPPALRAYYRNQPRVISDRMREMQQRAAEQQANLADVRGQIAETWTQQAELGRFMIPQFQGMMNQRQSTFTAGVNERQQILNQAQENLQRIQGMQASLTFTLAGYAPFEVKQATQEYRRALASGQPPRADMLRGALGAMITGGSPEMVERFERMYQQQPGIAEALRITGFPKAVGGARQAVKDAETALEEFMKNFAAGTKKLNDTFEQFVARTIQAIEKSTGDEANQVGQRRAQQLNAVKEPQE